MWTEYCSGGKIFFKVSYDGYDVSSKRTNDFVMTPGDVVDVVFSKNLPASMATIDNIRSRDPIRKFEQIFQLSSRQKFDLSLSQKIIQENFKFVNLKIALAEAQFPAD